MDDKIANKIRGLLRQAENTPYEKEAETFLQKAQELMIQHSIDEEILWARDPERRAKVELINIKITDNKPGSMERRTILAQIARLNSCKMWYTPGMDQSTVAGYPNDLLFVEMLYTSIATQMNFKMAIAQASSNGANARTFRANFTYAYSERICGRLREMYSQATQNITGTAGTALAIVDRKNQVEQWVSDNFNLTHGSQQRSGKYDAGARSAGRTAADNTDISAGRGRLDNRKALNG